MAGKGKKKGKKEKPKKDKINMVPNILTEVDRTFYELHIADLNRKINRLNELIDTMTIEQEHCEETYKQAEDEKTEQIEILRATLKERDQEIRDTQEAILLLGDIEEDEIKEHEEKIKELDEKYENTRRELTAQNKELEGQLVSLEEFALQQEALELKYEEQELLYEEREIAHKAEMEEIELKFQIVKQKLKRGMEARLLQLSTEFQEKAESQMPATTHRMVRENVSIHNELDILLLAEQKLNEENASLQEKNEEIMSGFRSHQSNKLYLLEQTKFQSMIIMELKKKYENLKYRIQSVFESNRYDEFHSLIDAIIKQQLTYDRLIYHNTALKKNLHGLRCRKERLSFNCAELVEKNNMLQYVLIEAVCAIEQALTPHKEHTVRNTLLQHLLHVLTSIDLQLENKGSSSSVGTMLYKDMEVPPTAQYRLFKHAVHVTRQNEGTQTTKSMEELPTFEEKLEVESSKVSIPAVVVQEEESELELSSTFSTKFYNDQESSHGSIQDTTESSLEDEGVGQSEKQSIKEKGSVDGTLDMEDEELGEEESERILLEIIAEQESLHSFNKSLIQSEQNVLQNETDVVQSDQSENEMG